jgi:hypothetical protein
MTFWEVIREQVVELRSAGSADDVVRILALDRNPLGGGEDSGADGFFAGSGGDDTVYDALVEAGWATAWYNASYHYSMRAPDGSAITYVEGDIYRGSEGGVR